MYGLVVHIDVAGAVAAVVVLGVTINRRLFILLEDE